MIGTRVGIFSGKGGFDSDAAIYLAAIGITDASPTYNIVGNLFKDLKGGAGGYSKIIAAYPCVTDKVNLFGYTEQFDNAYWQKSGTVTVTANTEVAPDGTTTADTCLLGNTSSTLFKQLGSFTTVGKTYTFSCYYKGTAGQTMTISHLTSSLQNKTITFTGDWQRETLTFTVSGTNYLYLHRVVGSQTGFSCYMWGAQLEEGSTASDYTSVGSQNPITLMLDQMKLNMINPIDDSASKRLSYAGSWAPSKFSLASNGTNALAFTYVVPSTDSTVDSLAIIIATRNNATSSGYAAGVTDGSGNKVLAKLRTASDEIEGNINDTTTTTVSSITDSSGVTIINRTASGTIEIYKDGVAQTLSGANASTAAAALQIYLGCQNNNGTAANYSANEYTFFAISEGLTASEAANITTAIETYNTALGR